MTMASDMSRPGGVLLGRFEFDAAEGCLRGDGREIRLRPKVASALRILVAHGGALVPTDDLYRAVWGEVAVTPNAVTNVLGELRRVLDRDAGLGRCIETVPRRGYRFVGPLRMAVAERHFAAISGFVGRDAELDVLHQAYADAGRGRRRVVFIGGEAGGGKTALLDRFAATLEGAEIASGHCPQAGSEPYAAILEVLAELGHSSLALDLNARMRRNAPAWLVHLPWVASLDERRTIARSLVGDGPGRMIREGVALLEELARERPVVLLFEDLHWADAPTVELISALCRGSSSTRLMVVGTYRSVDALVHQRPIVSAIAALRRKANVAVLPLAPFSIGEVVRCLENEFADDSVARELAEPIAMHCGGNPLFVKTVCEQLRQDGWVRHGADGLEVAADLQRFVPRLPEDLHALIELQLSALPEEDVRFLEAVSVVAEDATVELIAAALEESVERAVDLGHGIVRHGAYIKLVPAGATETYEFTHALYQRGVYNRMPPSRRAHLHARVGAHLEAQVSEFGGEGSLRIARHFEVAGDLERAAHYREQAGILAMQRFDHEQAIDSLERALGHLKATTTVGDLDLRRARLYLALANALTQRHGFVHPSVSEAFAQAEHHASAAGARHEKIRALLGVSSIPLAAGRPRDAVPSIERLLAFIAEAPETTRFYSYCRAARLAIVTGRFVDAHELLERGRGLPIEPGLPVQIDALAEAESWDSIALANLGFPTRARAAVERAIARAEEVGLPWGFAAVLAIVRHTAYLQSDYELAERIERRSHEHCARHDLPIYARLNRLFRLYLDGVRAPSKVGAEEFENILVEMRDIGEGGNASFHWILLAKLRLHVGDLAAAQRALDAALAFADDGGESHSFAEIWRLRGEALAVRRGKRGGGAAADASASIEMLRRACAIAREQGSAILEVRAAASLTEQLERCGDRDGAIAVLAAACERFPEPQGSAEVIAAMARLDELRSGTKRRGKGGPR